MPSLLGKVDKYNLTPVDFVGRLEKIIFAAIYNLYHEGVVVMDGFTIDNYVKDDALAKKIFDEQNGLSYIESITELANVENFDYYYKRLKKINLVNDLHRMGFETSDFWNDDLLDPTAADTNKKFDELEVQDIISAIRKKIVTVEKKFVQNEVTEARSASKGIREMLERLKTEPNMGLTLQGELFNEIVGGARKGTLYLRSAPSSVGKSRSAVADACYLAYPFRYNQKIRQWERKGSCQKVLYIMTEQNYDEIQRMVLSYLTGINGDKFKHYDLTPQEEALMQQACEVMEFFADNLIFVKVPDPSIEVVKNVIRENCLIQNIEYVFYDYIFVNPGLINEFRGSNLRNDELLLLFATALKDLATELDVFIMSSTQVNSKADDNTSIRNEAALAGGRSTINKADIGVIMARVTPEEEEALSSMIEKTFVVPNIVTDVFKVREGSITQVRIWSHFDLGTLRKEDLFVTDQRLAPVMVDIHKTVFQTWTDEYEVILKNKIRELNHKEPLPEGSEEPCNHLIEFPSKK